MPALADVPPGAKPIGLHPVGERPWSHSRWGTYMDCPFEFYLAYYMRIERPQHPAAARGDDIHKKSDRYLKGQLEKLPEELEQFKKEYQRDRKLGASSEEEWAFTKDWEPTSWFESDAPADKKPWLRVKTDIALPLKGGIVRVTDVKTGRVRDRGYEPQLELYALATFLMFDGIDEVQVALRYVDHKLEPERSYHVDQVPTLQKAWTNRVRPMQQDMRFDPKPSDHCRWCAFSAKRGGPCRY